MANPTLGIRIPNLVIEFDNEKGFEFRVQLEVPVFQVPIGSQIGELLASGDDKALGKAKQLVMDNIDTRATPGFKQIIEMAFDQNIEHVKKSPMKPASKPKKAAKNTKNK